MSLALVSEQTQEYVTAFEDFWLLYPKRCAKKDAKKMWVRMTEQQRISALTACAAWRNIWAAKDPEFLPHPATWLNGERWEDELPSSVSHSSHVAAKQQELPQRGQIPEHVRALLAKLRG